MNDPYKPAKANQQSEHQGVRYVTITSADAGQRIDNFLSRIAHSVPRSHVYRIIRTGQVRVNGGRIKPLYKLRDKDEVRIPPLHQVQRKTVRVPDALVDRLVAAIVFENDEFLLLNKPAGVAVHGGTGLHYGVVDAMRQHYDSPRIELAHRLDRGTSGCLLMGKSLAATRRAQDAFRQGRVGKRYEAIVSGHWAAVNLRVDYPLAANTEQGGQRKVVVSDDGKQALSYFDSVRQFASVGRSSATAATIFNATQVNIRIETGRTHQIRVHAAQSGHAVLGDSRYGNSQVNAHFRQCGLKRMFLHSTELRFDDEPGLDFNCPPDGEWQQALQGLADSTAG